MKIRLLGALVGLAIGFALLTFAQQKEPMPSDKDRQVSDALNKQTDDAWNNNDAACPPQKIRSHDFGQSRKGFVA